MQHLLLIEDNNEIRENTAEILELAGYKVQAAENGKTGVEMEALTAASVALLTIYDMAKAIDRGMTIGEIALAEKTGGAGGAFARA